MLTAGLGLKPAHFAEALADTSAGLWFEVHPENHLVDGGPRLAWLQAVGERHPLSLHGVSMSLAGLDRPDRSHLLRLSALVQQLNPALVSEHLAWCTWGGQVLPDLLPFVRDDAALARTATHINEVQQALGRRIASQPALRGMPQRHRVGGTPRGQHLRSSTVRPCPVTSHFKTVRSADDASPPKTRSVIDTSGRSAAVMRRNRADMTQSPRLS